MFSSTAKTVAGRALSDYALKDFFQSSIEDIDLTQLENVFVPAGKEGKTSIKVTFKPHTRGRGYSGVYAFSTAQNDTRVAEDTSIRDGNKLKSFLTYKHLLAIHHIKKDESINLFDLLVNGVLKHFKYSLTGGKEMGELWADVEEAIALSTGRDYPITRKRADVKVAIKAFNEAFGELFKPKSPEYILKHARPILEQLNTTSKSSSRFHNCVRMRILMVLRVPRFMPILSTQVNRLSNPTCS